MDIQEHTRRNLTVGNNKISMPNRHGRNNRAEKSLVIQLILELRSRGIIAGKVKTMGFRTKSGAFLKDFYLMTGLPDIFAFDEKKKIMYGIEAKVGKNKQTDNQIEFQRLFHCPPNRIYAIIYSKEALDVLLK